MKPFFCQSEFVVTEYTLELRICIEWILKVKPVHTYLDCIKVDFRLKFRRRGNVSRRF